MSEQPNEKGSLESLQDDLAPSLPNVSQQPRPPLPVRPPGMYYVMDPNYASLARPPNQPPFMMMRPMYYPYPPPYGTYPQQMAYPPHPPQSVQVRPESNPTSPSSPKRKAEDSLELDVRREHMTHQAPFPMPFQPGMRPPHFQPYFIRPPFPPPNQPIQSNASDVSSDTSFSHYRPVPIRPVVAASPVPSTSSRISYPSAANSQIENTKRHSDASMRKNSNVSVDSVVIEAASTSL